MRLSNIMPGSERTWIIIIVLLVIVALVIVGYFMSKASPATPTRPIGVACTMEAKLCPDGSYVGRSGPNCAFAACPGEDMYTDTNSGWSFAYPPTLSTSYINTVDWPPKLQIENTAFSCTEAGSPSAPAGQTQEKTVNGHTYCVTTETQGAAGSIYSQYAYAFAEGNQTATLTFALRYPQCGNYDEPRSTECETEKNNFNIDNIIDYIVGTLQPAAGTVQTK